MPAFPVVGQVVGYLLASFFFGFFLIWVAKFAKNLSLGPKTVLFAIIAGFVMTAANSFPTRFGVYADFGAMILFVYGLSVAITGHFFSPHRFFQKEFWQGFRQFILKLTFSE